MNAIRKFAVGSLMTLVWSLALAVEEVEKSAMAEPVSGFWIGVFFVAFIGLCVGIGVGVVRADKRAKAEAVAGK